MRQADYNDGRDLVSGDIITIVPITSPYELHVTDMQADTYLADQAAAALAAEERFDRHREFKLTAAIGSLEALIAEARTGNGHAASRCVEAAMSDLIIGTLGDCLKAARKALPADDPLITRIGVALDLAGVA